jgi:hypothetical protein
MVSFYKPIMQVLFPAIHKNHRHPKQWFDFYLFTRKSNPFSQRFKAVSASGKKKQIAFLEYIIRANHISNSCSILDCNNIQFKLCPQPTADNSLTNKRLRQRGFININFFI